VLVEHESAATSESVVRLSGEPDAGPPGAAGRLDVALQQARELLDRSQERGPRMLARHHLDLAAAEAVVHVDAVVDEAPEDAVGRAVVEVADLLAGGEAASDEPPRRRYRAPHTACTIPLSVGLSTR
jgi:hypothetical protein